MCFEVNRINIPCCLMDFCQSEIFRNFLFPFYKFLNILT
ncbi:protein of unassigned function [Methylobacterium oryzae CBMB20]|uniref:Protein of unassigned function n=1 Tax=Methylobacterium oryzae CBMB20 TaxID=693986 RepID=A0A089P3G7_9HYPH|nr:protein of unassigned function [Methylobacterium oryzae CBMB20]